MIQFSTLLTVQNKISRQAFTVLLKNPVSDPKQPLLVFEGLQRLFFLLLMILFFTACREIKTAGVKKDFTTGLTSTYQTMEPEKALLMMNDEVLIHTDIPFGESFLLINENVKGMQAKDGKVSIGCSLRISDENGTALLEEKDLFTGIDVFAKEEATRLKCTINTGAPMEWEKNYQIQVIFWVK